MDERLKIREVSLQYGVSTRTLRYYEQIGLLPSQRADDYAYRVYDGEALARLQQIMLLRSLRFSLSDIARMLNENDLRIAVEIFAKHLNALREENAALSKLREIVERFLSELQHHGMSHLRENALREGVLTSLMLSEQREKKEAVSMEELRNISEKTQKYGPIRILRLPAMRMAMYRAAIGPAPEIEGWGQVNKLFAANGWTTDDDVQIYGFDNPAREGDHGYEFRVRVPAGYKITAPFTEIFFPGGLYAAHVTPMHSIFETWMYLINTIKDDPRYKFDEEGHRGLEPLHPLLEQSIGEQPLQFADDKPEDLERQLDLLLPILPR